MARTKKNMISGVINLVMIAALIPVITSAVSSEDPAVTAIVALLPVVLLFNALGDFF